MKSKFYLIAGLSVLALTAGAQRLQTEYITWPNGHKLSEDVNRWDGSQLMEDENFFISRVKIKPYIDRNTVTQVFEDINDNNDKKCLFWVPVGNVKLNGVHTDGLPNGIFDSEVFSLWSYVTHYGDWTAPYGWVPGAFADAAHKHGTAVSGVASVPNATLSGDWLTALTNIGKVDPDKLGQFLLYHGVDGLAYNSEWGSGGGVQPGLNKIHEGVMKFMEGKNDKFENIWYTGVNDNGAMSFYDGLSSANQTLFGDSNHKRTSLFLNYNWADDYKITASRSTAQQLGRDMRDLYAGMNMQGGCKRSNEWLLHQQIEYSLGFWGAHDFNYLWSPRAQFGSSAQRKQETYQKLCEWWFSNGKRNPVYKLPIRQTGNLGSSADFHGVSRHMSERSTLGWDLVDEPFISYFNLGNGRFFNWKGERQNDNEWYVLGVQDYMPTWRFWFSSKFLGKDEADVPADGLDAEFTWNDAWFGGSSLRIFGSVSEEYLHLFKTSFELQSNYEITVRYKLLSGKADITLALAEGTQMLAADNLVITKASDCTADEDKWIEKKFVVKQKLSSELRNKNIAVIGLKFANAENLDMYLGEISLRSNVSATTPNAPKITLSKVLAYNYNGVDGKIIFEMPNNKPATEPCYNSDVNTSLFRVWAQQEGGEAINMGATTSWAAMVYAFPMNSELASKVRFGVQAVSTDFESASEITWGDYMDCGTYAISQAIQCNKSVIKPGEEFELSFVDPKHADGKWKITNNKGETMYETTAHSFTTKLSEIGAYNVEVDGTLNSSYITISAWDKGALPEILSVSVNGDESAAPVSIAINEEIELGYTGRESDGKSSQAIDINEQFVGFPFSDMGLEGTQSFAVGAWLKFEYPVANTRLHGIEDRSGSWPMNNWGWVACPMDENGSFTLAFRTGGPNTTDIKYEYKNCNFLNNTWTHLIFNYQWDGQGKFRLRTFWNGKEVNPTRIYWQYYTPSERQSDIITGDALKNPDNYWISNSYPIITAYWAYFGGGYGSEPVYNNGIVDDFVIFNGAITEADAQKAYAGLDAENLPSNVRCFWSFEDKAGDDNTFRSVGSLPNKPLSNYALIKDDGEGQAKPTPVMPSYNSGCPYLDGNFEVTAVPTWSAKRATITEQAGTHTEGKAKIKFDREGSYTVKLTLENALGSHSREYPVISVGNDSGIESVDNAENAEVYTVDDAIFVSVADGGNYTVAVYDMAGRLVAQRSAAMEGNTYMSLNVRQAGAYLVHIACDGNVVRTVKVVKN